MQCIKCNVELPEGAIYCHMCGKKQEIPTRTPRKRGNRQGCAYKRGKTWTGCAAGYSYTEVTPDGKTRLVRRRPTQGGFKTKTEALAWAAAQEPEKDAPMPTMIELWTGWSENDMLQLSKSKQTAYKIARKRLEGIMGMRIDSLTVDQLQQLVNEQCETYYTARDVKSLLSHLYKRAMASNVNRGRVTLNLSDFLVLPELEEAEAEPFTQEEVRKIWAAYEAGDHFLGYILLMIYTGMMPVEILTCRKDMVDLERCEIFGCGAKTKKRKQTSIVFPVFMRAVVEDLLQLKPGDKLLPINRDSFYDEFYSALERADVRKLKPYSCRHTYGTEAVKLAIPPAVVAQMLRHSNTKMQERYTHLGTEEAHAAADSLVNIRGVPMADKEAQNA